MWACWCWKLHKLNTHTHTHTQVSMHDSGGANPDELIMLSEKKAHVHEWAYVLAHKYLQPHTYTRAEPREDTASVLYTDLNMSHALII